MRDPLKHARAYASTRASGHTCKRDFNMCWGCWKVPAAVVFCPACKTAEDVADRLKEEKRFRRKEQLARQYKGGRRDGYYNY